jgi:ribosomal protein S18 acetylase RimI-like enzyme
MAIAEIVQLTEEDADQVHELLRISWRDTHQGLLPEEIIITAETVWHSADTLRRQMRNRDVLFAGFKAGDGELLGVVRAAMFDDAVKIFQLYVLPSHQRRGIGRELMDYAVSNFPQCKKLTLEVAEGNIKGISFYKKYGFTFPRKTVMKVGDNEIHNLEGELLLR